MAAAITLALTGSGARPVAAIAMDPTNSEQVQLLAKCFDACTVNVGLSGNGSGTWKSTNSSYVPNGLINCAWVNGAQAPGSDCTETYCCIDRAQPLRIYFVLTPATGSEACYLSVCDQVEVKSYDDLPDVDRPITKSLGGTFNLLTYPVAVSRSGTAANSGGVTSSPAGITCPPTCLAMFAHGTQLTLTAVATPGSYFERWSGACLNQAAACQLTVSGPVDTTATFILGSPPTPSPPAPTPTATSIATVKPTGTPKPGTSTALTGAATASPMPSSGQDTTPAGGTDDPLASPGAASPEASGEATTPVPTEPPDVPAAAGSDFTPIVLAILGAGLLIAIGIGFAAFTLRRKAAPPA